MFDNVLHQSAADLLEEDIARHTLPGSILLSGPEASGKLTTALELARVLSCQNAAAPGQWNCTCRSCLRHKALVSPTVLVAGNKNQTLEIAAARATLLAQNANNTTHLEAARYLYLRAVRKLTIRFSPILWEGDDKLAKFSPLLQAIDEELEQLEPGRTLPDGDALGKLTETVQKHCEKLENTFLYAALPVSQIRSAASWAHLSTAAGKKVLIIESADQMAESARNALLKILEEPPENVLFVLTTARRGAVLPTILSRVRTYQFFERSAAHQQEVVQRVFHYDPVIGSGAIPPTIQGFLQTYLPVSPGAVKEHAAAYFRTVCQGHVPDIPQIVQGCAGFDPRALYRIFMQALVDAQRTLPATPAGASASARIMQEFRRTFTMVTVYNQSPAASLEELSRTLMHINHVSSGIMREACGE